MLYFSMDSRRGSHLPENSTANTYWMIVCSSLIIIRLLIIGEGHLKLLYSYPYK